MELIAMYVFIIMFINRGKMGFERPNKIFFGAKYKKVKFF